MKQKISEDIVELTIQELENEFGSIPSNNVKEIIKDVIQSGNLVFEDSKGEVIYELQKPIKKDNGEILNKLKFYEPTLAEMKEISRGSKLKANTGGVLEIDTDTQRKLAMKMVTVFNSVPDGILDRLKRRDVAVIEALSYFFA
jgi:polyhydroxyalkanoate synthesis regulator phasin